MIRKCILLTLFLFTTFLLASCGGGGGSGPAPVQPTTATLKLSSNGTLASGTALGGIGITVVLPNGVTVKTDTGGAVLNSVVTISGAATSGSYTPPTYIPAAGATPAKLSFVMASSAVAGFGTGEFATVVCDIATGANPAAVDFTLTGFDPRDTGGHSVTGLTASVAATMQ